MGYVWHQSVNLQRLQQYSKLDVVDQVRYGVAYQESASSMKLSCWTRPAMVSEAECQQIPSCE